MGLKVAVYRDPLNRRSRRVAEAVEAGLRAAGCETVGREVVSDDEPVVTGAGLAVAYGWRWSGVFEQYRRAGMNFAHVDLGYWLRKPPNNPLGGFHKVAFNARDPKLYLDCPGDRFDLVVSQVPLNVQPWCSPRSRDTVVIAGMSEKAAQTYGLAAELWETNIARRVNELRDPAVRLVYRPKPSWTDWSCIKFADEVSLEADIEVVLRKSRLLITHHSNSAIDALVHGVPVYVEEGPVRDLSVDLGEGVLGAQPEAVREPYLRALAYCQWSMSELATSAPWQWYVEHGELLP